MEKLNEDDLIKDEVYQYKDDNYDILGIYIGKDTRTYGDKTTYNRFKTLSSVDNAWNLEYFIVSTDDIPGYVTKL